MTPEQKFKIGVLRNYLRFLAEVAEDRKPGQWGDISWASHDDHYADPRPDEEDIFANPFALAETSHYGQVWVTLWADPDQAVQYHAGQEYAEDWRIDRLVDIRDMTEYRLTAKAEKA